MSSGREGRGFDESQRRESAQTFKSVGVREKLLRRALLLLCTGARDHKKSSMIYFVTDRAKYNSEDKSYWSKSKNTGSKIDYRGASVSKCR